MFLIATVLVPALDALHSGVQAGDIHADEARMHFRLTGKIEEVLAQPFSELDSVAQAAGGPTVVIDAYSDPAGTTGRRLVYVARYDGDNADADDDPFSGVDDGLLWVRVAIEGSPNAIESLSAR